MLQHIDAKYNPSPGSVWLQVSPVAHTKRMALVDPFGNDDLQGLWFFSLALAPCTSYIVLESAYALAEYTTDGLLSCSAIQMTLQQS